MIRALTAFNDIKRRYSIEMHRGLHGVTHILSMPSVIALFESIDDAQLFIDAKVQADFTRWQHNAKAMGND